MAYLLRQVSLQKLKVRLRALPDSRRYCVLLRPLYAVSETAALEVNVLQKALFIAACRGEVKSHH